MTVNVLITSDTHVCRGADLPDALLELASRADHIIHGGDCITADVLDTLEALAPVTAACGNVDDAQVAARLGATAEVELAGIRIAVLHVPGPAAGRAARLRARFPDADVIVYGHTHLPDRDAGELDDALVLNPGSPTDRRRAPWHSVCWAKFDQGAVSSVELVNIDTPLTIR